MTKIFSFRLTLAELALLRSQAYGKTLTAYVRDRLDLPPARPRGGAQPGGGRPKKTATEVAS